MARKFAVELSAMPSPEKEKVAAYGALSGGLNLWELDYRMDADQSPEMKNLWWRDGLLGCRDGQEYVWQQPLGKGLCCYEGLFWDHWVAHIGDSLYGGRPGTDPAPVKLCDGLPEVRGSFLRYGDVLLYKTAGAYKRLRWENGLVAEDVPVYTPVTVINCGTDGSGDLYQPENRLCAKKTVWYNAAEEVRSAGFTTAMSKAYTLQPKDAEPVTAIRQVYLSDVLLDPTAYTVSEDKLTVTLREQPSTGKTLGVFYSVGQRVYTLPVTEVDAIDEVLVDGKAVTDYTADLQAGTVTFAVAPPVQDPPVNNTVHITYSKENPDAEKSIMDCRYGAVFGGTGGAVLVLAGSENQPNACFWNGSHIHMDAGYFPMEYYNLVGDSLEPVTGFGKQAGYLVVFKERSVGRCVLGAADLEGRAYLTMDYTPINAAVGCDLPWTIRLVENNLVWCNTYGGVQLLRDTTAAMENTVVCISRNVAGCDSRPGLLADLQKAEQVCALEDGERYWVCTGDHAYVWDHRLSEFRKPSWFFFTNIPAVSFFQGDSQPLTGDGDAPFTGVRRVYHLDSQGRTSRFVRSFRDYGGAIEKVYRFAALNFGSYERRKHIRKVILTTRSDTDSVIHVEYETDYERRRELTPIVCFGWRLVPRNLAYRFLGQRKFAHVAVRTPCCRGVRHFSMRLENREAGCDLSVVSAQVHFRLAGKEW